MKFSTVILNGILLAVATSVWAKVVPPRPLFLDTDVTVNGAKVPEGMYNLVVETQGSSVRASLWRDGRFVASAHGTWVKHGVKYGQTAILLRVNPDGTRSLSEIRLAGSAKTIVIDEESPILRIGPGTNSRSDAPSTGTQLKWNDEDTRPGAAPS